jgi:hypothetical protein
MDRDAILQAFTTFNGAPPPDRSAKHAIDCIDLFERSEPRIRISVSLRVGPEFAALFCVHYRWTIGKKKFSFSSKNIEISSPRYRCEWKGLKCILVKVASNPPHSKTCEVFSGPAAIHKIVTHISKSYSDNPGLRLEKDLAEVFVLSYIQSQTDFSKRTEDHVNKIYGEKIDPVMEALDEKCEAECQNCRKESTREISWMIEKFGYSKEELMDIWNSTLVKEIMTQ